MIIINPSKPPLKKGRFFCFPFIRVHLWLNPPSPLQEGRAIFCPPRAERSVCNDGFFILGSAVSSVLFLLDLKINLLERNSMDPHPLLPEQDYWSTPFAQALLMSLDLFPGATVLDVAAGGGIPAFYLAEQVGPEGQVLAVDIHQSQVLRARTLQGARFPWLKFEVGDMRSLPPTLPEFDRITGNLSFMFFRPNRFDALKSLIRFLKPGGQIVLTFPSLGTFDSLWNRVEQEMSQRKLENELQALAEYIEERPSTAQAAQWLKELGMEKVAMQDLPLEVKTGSGVDFLEHPLLRGGFLDDIYECFQDPALADEFMTVLSEDIASFTPLYALRGVIGGWAPG